MVTLEFRVALPIFAAHRQDATIASKRAAVEQLAAEREAARRMHAAELEKTVAAWRASRARAKRYEDALLPLAQSRADAALAAYRGGAGSLREALAALEAAVETRLAYADVESALGASWAQLHYAFAEEH